MCFFNWTGLVFIIRAVNNLISPKKKAASQTNKNWRFIDTSELSIKYFLQEWRNRKRRKFISFPFSRLARRRHHLPWILEIMTRRKMHIVFLSILFHKNDKSKLYSWICLFFFVINLSTYFEEFTFFITFHFFYRFYLSRNFLFTDFHTYCDTYNFYFCDLVISLLSVISCGKSLEAWKLFNFPLSHFCSDVTQKAYIQPHNTFLTLWVNFANETLATRKGTA